jgi:carbohydrate kinase (thermoresistant glucokinase family)
MGVAGAGKTTVGRALAAVLGWPFIEGDDFHPAANVEKMLRGVPLSEADRRPWLLRLREEIRRCVGAGHDAVVACSALKASHRDVLKVEGAQTRFVLLGAPQRLIRGRLTRRPGHFMPAGLLDSQIEALEVPADALALDARRPVPELVASIREALGLNGGQGG